MNNSMPEILHCINPNSLNTEMSVLERQRARLNWQEEQLIQQHPVVYLNGNDQLSGVLFGNNDPALGQLLMGRAMKPGPGTGNGWVGDDLGRLLNYGNGSEIEAIPRTASCPPAVAAAMAEVAAIKGKDTGFGLSPETGKGNLRKRKADKSQNIKASGEENNQEKKTKGCVEEEGSKITEEHSNSKSTTTNASKKKEHSGDKSSVSDAPKQDYIHVRARRGQATDSHSLAERVRREKISDRMKYLQDLVPGCNKITGKAGMLDEIINYVQSLQKQVEFLSMKLAAINPQLDCEASKYLFKEQLFAGCSSSMVDPCQLQFNALTQGASVPGLDIGVISSDATLRRTISAPVHIPDTILDSSCYSQLNWETEMQNLLNMEYQQGRLASYVSQPLTGYMETGDVKMEM